MATINRGNSLVSVTTCVLATGAKVRLAARMFQHGHSEEMTVVVERYETVKYNPDLVITDWTHDESTRIYPKTVFVADAINNIKQKGAYCAVFNLDELLALAESMHMRWVAKSL